VDALLWDGSEETTRVIARWLGEKYDCRRCGDPNDEDTPPTLEIRRLPLDQDAPGYPLFGRAGAYVVVSANGQPALQSPDQFQARWAPPFYEDPDHLVDQLRAALQRDRTDFGEHVVDLVVELDHATFKNDGRRIPMVVVTCVLADASFPRRPTAGWGRELAEINQRVRRYVCAADLWLKSMSWRAESERTSGGHSS